MSTLTTVSYVQRENLMAVPELPIGRVSREYGEELDLDSLEDLSLQDKPPELKKGKKKVHFGPPPSSASPRGLISPHPSLSPNQRRPSKALQAPSLPIIIVADDSPEVGAADSSHGELYPTTHGSDGATLPETNEGSHTMSKISSAICGELLDIVRKHWDAGPAMERRYWREMVDMLFVRGSRKGESSLQSRRDGLFDDMLFFVRQAEEEQYERAKESDSSSHDRKPVFVRKWAGNLRRVVGDSEEVVDWHATLFLNIICHTTYSLTVAVCSLEALEEYRRNPKRTPLTPLRKVTKRVYAFPECARVDKDAPKTQVGLTSYPTICFAIDDYNDPIDSMELTDADHCLCVMLKANGGAPYPGEEAGMGGRRGGERSDINFGEGSEDFQVTIFSGFVNYSMLKNSFHGGKRGGFLWGASELPPERLVMRGPGGRGEADVIVNGFVVKGTEPGSGERRERKAEASGSRRAGPTSVTSPKPPRHPGLSPPPKLKDLQSQLAKAQQDLGQLAVGEAGAEGKLEGLKENLATLHAQLEVMYKRQLKAGSTPQAVESFGEMMRAAVGPTPVLVLDCSLRTLSIPWQQLAYDLLFKHLPLKVDINGKVQGRYRPAKQNPK